MNNKWQDCKQNPPPEYTRIEIKDSNNKHYVGYRYQQKYYETYGNWLIKNPRKWRYIPATSYLLVELKEKLSNIWGSETVYANRGKDGNCL